MTKQIQKQYRLQFQKEVDFHHRLAYKFERAYKLGRRNPEKKRALDLETLDLIGYYSDYVEDDPLVLFYCLFFCIYFNNAFVVEFLRALFGKLEIVSSATKAKLTIILSAIDLHGLERVRTVGDAQNAKIYHLVLYQAMDDKLRVVYSKILAKLPSIQLRNKDAVVLLTTRDYSLIKVCLSKATAKIAVNDVQDTEICHSYKAYNPAYFEEVLLDPDNKVDERVAHNYRERFLTDKEAIYQVLLMYSKKDYLDFFLEMRDIERLSPQQLVTLFTTCVKNDSFKLGFQLYCRFLTPADMSLPVLKQILKSLDSSPKFMEIKFFFLHEHFRSLDVDSLNKLLDTLLSVLERTTYHLHPIINAYNTLKTALLIRKTTFMIEQLNIYALITKCELINNYLEKSILNYLDLQSNIRQLSLFLLEPILGTRRQQDSLDLMLEMHLDQLLNHPVVIEVLDLVYEGKYSVNSSWMELSQTLAAFFNYKVFDLKSVQDQLKHNIMSLAGGHKGVGEKVQSSLQFHIWKHCIQQRLLDEAVLIVLNCILLFLQASSIISILSQQGALERKWRAPGLEGSASMAKFCSESADLVLKFEARLASLTPQLWISSLAFLSGSVCKLLTLKLKSQAYIDMRVLLYEVVCASLGFSFLIQSASHELRPGEEAQVVDACSGEIPSSQLASFSLLQSTYILHPLQVLSLLVMASTLHMLGVLKRTSQFGYLIIMMQEMISELGRYLSTFFLVLVFFFLALRFMTLYFIGDAFNTHDSFLDTFNLMLGKTSILDFKFPQGQLYVLACAYLSKTFLFSIMIAMFVMRYFFVWQNIEATRRMDIIKLKNTQQYDPLYGCITMSYFPVNAILLPFFLPVVLFKSRRLNGLLLEAQYYLLILLYLSLALIIFAVVLPLLFIKVILNKFYLWRVRRSTLLWSCALVFVAPFLILASVIVDLVKLYPLLMEKRFEHKYPKVQALAPDILFPVTHAFYIVFIIKFEKVYKNKGKSEFSLLLQHRRIFSIQDNFHSVFCTGDQKYEESINNIKLFNLTKVLGGMASIPSEMGEKRHDFLNYDLVAAIFEDIIMFNYFEYTLAHVKAGEDLEGLGETLLKYGYPERKYNRAKHDWCMATMTRDFSDLFNFFSVNIVTQAFTKVREIARTYQMETNFLQEKKQGLQIDRLREEWQQSLTATADALSWQMSERVEEMRIRMLSKDKQREAAAAKVAIKMAGTTSGQK